MWKVIGADGALIERRRQSGSGRLGEGLLGCSQGNRREVYGPTYFLWPFQR